MEETLNHLEKVIRDVPNGSQEVEPTNHIEKVIQEVGQEVIGMIPSGGGGELYEHHIRLFSQSNSYKHLEITFTLITSLSSFTKDTLWQYIMDNLNNGYVTATGYFGDDSLPYYQNIVYMICPDKTNDMIVPWVMKNTNTSGTLDKVDHTFAITKTAYVHSSMTFTDTVIQILGGE